MVMLVVSLRLALGLPSSGKVHVEVLLLSLNRGYWEDLELTS